LRVDSIVADGARHALMRINTRLRMRSNLAMRTGGTAVDAVTPSPPVAERGAGTPEPRIEALVEKLRDPACYPHPVGRVAVKETHISWVLLAGDFAYKLKKPVRLPFLDFSSPIARRHFCQEELRLNRRTAPGLYLSVECVGGDPARPRIGDCDPVWEYAVKMRRFPQEALYSELAQAARLTPAHVDALADALADFHQAIAGPPPPKGLGAADPVLRPALDNFTEMEAIGGRDPLLARLEAWTRMEQQAVTGKLNLRRHDGFVRECHGDLHLANCVWLDGRAVLFDGIEFAARLRWIDVMSDVAFAFMDLAHHGLPRMAWRLVNRYLEHTGDYAGLDLLRYYAVYRALVRAKVALIRSRQAGLGEAAAHHARAEWEAYVRRAAAMAGRPAPVLVLMHGLSGSGKTTASQLLLEAAGAVRLRSDVERKRMHGMAAQAASGSGVAQGLYSGRNNDLTYSRLMLLARRALAAGYPVIVDAAFLERSRREDFRSLAQSAGAGFHIVSCVAPPAVLRERVAARAAAAADASEAGLKVLEAQLSRAEPLTEAERDHATLLETASADEWRRNVEALAAPWARQEEGP
jgi:aminoglycoside phosphotransferase family enzyme/predicted kinase